MSQDAYRLLKDTGYLNSPATRFLWKNASPTFRNHARQWLLLALCSAIPLSLITAGLTLLTSWRDRIFLFAFYLVAIMAVYALLDGAIALANRFRRVARFWAESRFLSWLPIPLSGLLLACAGLYFEDAIATRAMAIKIVIWALLALAAWIAAKSCSLLVVSRLYWHGVAPPRLRHYSALMALVAAGMIVFLLLRARPASAPAAAVTPRPPLLLLAFDAPEPMFETYLALLPDWPRQEWTVAETDITNFWTSVGCGSPREAHQASLVAYRTPLFRQGLNRRDPTQRLPLALFELIDWAEPRAEGGRYRKYFWEILDERQLRAFGYAFWHTFPASAQSGGALSERWSHENQQSPFLAGMRPLTTQPPPLEVPAAAAPAAQRESQTWAQLLARATRGDFDLCVAYFPLGDLLDSLPPARQAESQRRLSAYRADALARLLGALPADASIGILIASGKTGAAAGRVRATLASNWFPAADPFESPFEIAPTILNHYGLPADRLMTPSRYQPALATLSQKVDYGEPIRRAGPSNLNGSDYYEELKSLGYVQ